jgi:hypothetical protein
MAYDYFPSESSLELSITWCQYNVPGNGGDTLLHKIVGSSISDVVKFLLVVSGADMNAQNKLN